MRTCGTPLPVISVVGAGNVGTAFAQAFHRAGVRVATIYSRTPHRAEVLARRVGAVPCSGGLPIPGAVDFILLAVPDQAIVAVFESLGRPSGIVVHTSGATPLPRREGVRTGVLYPFQTFTQGREVEWAEVPVFVEGSSPEVRAELEALAGRLSRKVCQADSHARLLLHLVGVLLNNFTNALLYEAQGLLCAAGFDLELVRPILEETLEKALEIGPGPAQTGPARRGDSLTIARHLELLQGDRARLRLLYERFTELIQAQRHEPCQISEKS